MGYLLALAIVTLWPLCAVQGQQLARRRQRDPELWLFLCGLGGPALLALLALLPAAPRKPRGHPLLGRTVGMLAGLFLFGVICFSLFRSCLGWG